MITRYTTESGSIYEVDTGADLDPVYKCRQLVCLTPSKSKRVSPVWKDCCFVGIGRTMIIIWMTGLDAMGNEDPNETRSRITYTSRIVRSEQLPHG